MVSQGWEEGAGIGKDKRGTEGCIRVKNKQRIVGLFFRALIFSFDRLGFSSLSYVRFLSQSPFEQVETL